MFGYLLYQQLTRAETHEQSPKCSSVQLNWRLAALYRLLAVKCKSALFGLQQFSIFSGDGFGFLTDVVLVASTTRTITTSTAFSSMAVNGKKICNVRFLLPHV